MFRRYDFTGELNALTNDVINRSNLLRDLIMTFWLLVSIKTLKAITSVNPLVLCVYTPHSALFSPLHCAPLVTGDTRALVPSPGARTQGQVESRELTAD